MSQPPQDFAVDDLSDVVDELATGIYAVNRMAAAGYTNGVKDTISNIASSFTVRALVSPTSGVQLQRLPEGQRTKQTITILSTVELRTAGAEWEPDQIVYSGDTYQIEASERWQQSGNFWRALAQRVSDR